MDVTYYDPQSGTVIARRNEAEGLKSMMIDICRKQQEWALDDAVYRITGVNVSPASQRPQRILVALEYVRAVIEG
jgi:hypothetical protein